MPLGLISGYIGGKLDELIIMRIVDALMAMPGLILILAVTGALGPSITNSMIVIGIVWSPGYARLTRGIIVSIRNDVYVDAARALGATPWRIMWRHLLPNAVAPIMVLASLSAAGIILVEAGLSFIGAGVQPPTPAWGGMVSEAYKTLIRRNGWPMIGPAAAIILMVIAFNFVGDGIRDAFDPAPAQRPLARTAFEGQRTQSSAAAGSGDAAVPLRPLRPFEVVRSRIRSSTASAASSSNSTDSWSAYIIRYSLA